MKATKEEEEEESSEDSHGIHVAWVEVN